MPAARATKADIQRCIRATEEAGLPVTGVEVTLGGTIRILTTIDKPEAKRENGPKSWDE